MIWIGTSGYSFDDWHLSFYPPGLKRGQRLNYYVRHFKTVEVNSTYYRLPNPIVLRQMERKTPPGFRFLVKLNQAVTHRGVCDRDHFRTFLEVIEPLEDDGDFSEHLFSSGLEVPVRTRVEVITPVLADLDLARLRRIREKGCTVEIFLFGDQVQTYREEYGREFAIFPVQDFGNELVYQ